MKSTLLGQHEISDIDQAASKILKALGYPEPPVSLDDVRLLLKLDRKYFSSDDDSHFREFVSRITVAGRQIALRPSILIDVIKKASLTALYLPDTRRILIDQNTPKLKHRWSEAHEIGHSIIPWHENYLFGDNEHSLSVECHEQLEAEANYAAGRLLFCGNRFLEEGNDYEPTISSIRQLTKIYGNTLTSTLWRFVEETHQNNLLVGIVSDHPRRLRTNHDPEEPCRHLIKSNGFLQNFPHFSEKQAFQIISKYCRPQAGGPLGGTELELTNENGECIPFRFESFSNTHYVLTIGHAISAV